MSYGPFHETSQLTGRTWTRLRGRRLAPDVELARGVGRVDNVLGFRQEVEVVVEPPGGVSFEGGGRFHVDGLFSMGV